MHEHYAPDEDISAATGALLAFGSSLLAASTDATNLETLSVINTWLPWIPKAPLDLGSRRVPFMVICMYYNAMFLAFASYTTVELLPLFLGKRAESILQNWTTLVSLTAEQRGFFDGSVEDTHDTLLHFGIKPSIYARMYIAK
jgi:hypothetical protein